jgi:hypothetical protein
MVRIDPKPKQSAGLAPHQVKLLRQLEVRRRRKRVGGVVFLALLLALLFGLGVILAKTGIWDIPFFSKHFYRAPEPVRTVTVEEQSPEGIRFELTETNEVQVTLTESELTGIFQQWLAAQADPPLAPTAQIVITPEFFELFGLLQKPITAPVRIELVPVIRTGELHLELRSLHLGQVEAPAFVHDALNAMLADGSLTLAAAVEDFGAITSLELGDGQLTLTGKRVETSTP